MRKIFDRMVLGLVMVGLFICVSWSVVSAKKPYEGVTLHLIVASHPAIDAMKTVIPEFEKKYGVKIVPSEIRDILVYDKMKIAFSGAKPVYDIGMMDCIYTGEFAKKGLAEPLDPYLMNKELADPNYDAADIIPGYRELFSWKGKRIALPISGESTIFAYRKDVYKKHGFTVPQTWDEFLIQARKLTDKERGFYGVTLGLERGDGMCYSLQTLIYPFGGRYFDEQMRPQLNSEPWIRALKYLIKLKEYAPLGVENYGYDDMAAALQMGIAAVYLHATNVPYLENPEFSKVTGKLGYALHPKDKKRVHALAGWSLAIASNSQHKEAAYKFLEFVTNKENDRRLALTGAMPNRVSTYHDAALRKKFPYYDVVYQCLIHGIPNWYPRIPENKEIMDIVGLISHEALLGQRTPKDALDECQKKVDKILREAGYYE